jgi:hypothetical protein
LAKQKVISIFIDVFVLPPSFGKTRLGKTDLAKVFRLASVHLAKTRWQDETVDVY